MKVLKPCPFCGSPAELRGTRKYESSRRETIQRKMFKSVLYLQATYMEEGQN